MERLQNISEKDILFLDIETVPMCASYEQLPPTFQALWAKKAAYWMRDDETPDQHFHRAGIYAEFGKIVCISVGTIVFHGGRRHLRVKTFAHHNEHQLLSQFAQLCRSHFNGKQHHLAAHNGKEFDFPYTARRMLIQGIELPPILDFAGRKPWEVRHIDTLELWKFGDYKNYTSLQLLTTVFGIPTPKDDIDGSEVAAVYYLQNDLPRIARYCQKDVVALVQLFLRYKNQELIPDERIEFLPLPEIQPE